MLPLSLGLAWLLLAPLCLWLLVKGSRSERAGAIVTLALLEAGTITMNSLHPTIPVQQAAAHTMPAPPAPHRTLSSPGPVSPAPAARTTVLPGSCDEHDPVPRSARVGKELVLVWPALPRECGAAEVTLRARGRELLIWLHESPHLGERGSHPNVLVRPVVVTDGMASLRVPLPGRPDCIPTDGRSGRRIPRSEA
ncbi:hypothetical protein AB0I81_32105 [Nonomuraea sp. NPDC050404]|uniref:hypothetical protein n=1 Tax=Nonomuraea sp. NPDC050404 TaxID=3155783 RepID=UPI0034090C31